MGKISWGRLFRRGVAVCLATLALWALLLSAGAGAVAGELRRLSSSERFVTAVLRAELGDSEGGLPFWQRLAVGQSALLEANPGGKKEEPAQTSPLPMAQPAPDHDDVTEERLPQHAGTGDIVERTLVPATDEGYVTGGGLYLYNRTNLKADLSKAVRAKPDISLSPAQEGPQILILHTHATEAYTPDGGDTYLPSDNSRTLDEGQNMLRVGDEMERVFTEMGLNVIHDRSLYDYPKYAGAYSRSGAGVKEYLERYPTVKLVLDVHRDALVGGDGTVYKVVTDIDGVKTAQVMLVVGSGEGHPNWEKNLTLAAKLQKNLDTLYPTLARPMTLRQSVYNQDLAPGSLLVEVGSHGNTLQEALAGARAFARCAGAAFLALAEE